MTPSIAVVILHYNDAEMTINYINNLRSLNWSNIEYHFIIVDNCSPDGSGKVLKEEYADDPEITVILSSSNLGFAKGNNLGICHAAKTYAADLIIVSNNDIKINDLDFPQKLWSIQEEEEAAVIGVDVYSLDKEHHQSPIRTAPINAYELQKMIKGIDCKLLALRIVNFTKTYDLISSIKRKIGKKPGIEGYMHDIRQENVVVHGAFFCLSRHYMDAYPDGLFDKTFLYMEEDILAYRCQIKSLKTLYTPALRVLHYDGYSTKKQTKNRCNKYIFELQETKKSCEVMYNMILGEPQ